MMDWVDDELCNNNGKGTLFPKKKCKCFSCYTGEYCTKAVENNCRGTINTRPFRLKFLEQQPNNHELDLDKCVCGPLQAGPCCQKNKCFGHGYTWTEVEGRCKCGEKQYGSNCQKVRCKNKGKVRKHLTKWYCECDSLFTGPFCETPKCGFHGTINAEGTQCDCNDHYLGVHCNILSCGNHGRAIYSSADPVCRCGWLYSGPYCEESALPKIGYAAAGIFAFFCLCFCYYKCQSVQNRDYNSTNLDDPENREPANGTGPDDYRSSRLSTRYAQYFSNTSDSHNVNIHHAPHELVSGPTEPVDGRFVLIADGQTRFGWTDVSNDHGRQTTRDNGRNDTNNHDRLPARGDRMNDANDDERQTMIDTMTNDANDHRGLTPPPDYSEVTEEPPPPYNSVVQ